jgi:enoyl-CoA hydratase
MNDSVAIEIDDRIAILKLNREKNLNAVSADLARGVADGLIKLDDDAGVDGIVLTGAGDRAFCAGVDLIEARDAKPADIESWFGNVCNIYQQILATRKPVIAAVNGVAAGAGFQMALVSDMRVVSRTAKLGQPEINAGIPSVMGSYWMSLHIGWSKNQELSFTGRLMDAEEAHHLGIANHLVEPDQVIPKAREIAQDFAAKPKVAWARTKARFREVAMRGFDDAFRAGVLGQQEAFAAGEPQAVIEKFLASRGKK